MPVPFDLNRLSREDLQSLVPYDAHHYPGVVRLDANENPYDFPLEAREEIIRRAAASEFNRYPDPMARHLREKISLYIRVPPGNIMVGNGSDELIINLMLAFVSGAKAVVATPTFSMYALNGRVAGAGIIEAPRRDDFSIDAGELIRAGAGPAVKVIITCTPNNPTGNATSRAVLEEVLAGTGALVVVDEAYGEFGGESCVPLLEHYPNLVVLRTFSKALGLAGLRVGYLMANEPVISQLLKVKLPFNLNFFSQMAAQVVLECLPPFQERVAEILAERDRFYRRLSLVTGVEVFPSDANFILFRTALPSADVYRGLLDKGVLIRNVSGPGLANCLRVTVGRPEENEIFLSKISEIMEEGSW